MTQSCDNRFQIIDSRTCFSLPLFFGVKFSASACFGLVWNKVQYSFTALTQTSRRITYLLRNFSLDRQVTLADSSDAVVLTVNGHVHFKVFHRFWDDLSWNATKSRQMKTMFHY